MYKIFVDKIHVIIIVWLVCESTVRHSIAYPNPRTSLITK